MTEILYSDSSDERHAIQRALDYRLVLMAHLATSLQTGGLRLAQQCADAFPAKTPSERDAQVRLATQAVIILLLDAELVLWRGDLRKCAHAQAEHFSETVVDDADLPNDVELWFPYAQVTEMETIGGEQDAYALTFELLIPSLTEERPSGEARSLWRMGFSFPSRGDVIDVHEQPLVTFEEVLRVGEPPYHIEGRKMLSCLTFRASKFVTDERVASVASRAARRRMKKSGTSVPIVRVVNLRRREQKDTEKNTETSGTPSQYHCQWFVRPHVRKPNRRMKEQRPIWVEGYIKGPPDKPLKAPSLNIKVVKR